MATYYLNTSSGSDAAAGTIAAPWLTLLHALVNSASGDVIEATADGTHYVNLNATGPGIIDTAAHGFRSSGVLDGSAAYNPHGTLDSGNVYHQQGILVLGTFYPYGVVDQAEDYHASGYLDALGVYSSGAQPAPQALAPFIAYQNSGFSFTVGLFDTAGNPFSLGGKTLSMEFYDPNAPGAAVFTLTTSGGLAISGESSNNLTVTVASTQNAAPMNLRWILRDDTDGADHAELYVGSYEVKPAPPHI